MNRNELTEYIAEMYNTAAEYPWDYAPGYAVFRHACNKKWFAVIMNISRRKLGINSDEIIDVMNLKCDSILMGSLRNDTGIFPAYHMSKTSWISVALDGSVDSEKIKWLLDISFDLTDKKRKK